MIDNLRTDASYCKWRLHVRVGFTCGEGGADDTTALLVLKRKRCVGNVFFRLASCRTFSEEAVLQIAAQLWELTGLQVTLTLLWNLGISGDI